MQRAITEKKVMMSRKNPWGLLIFTLLLLSFVPAPEKIYNCSKGMVSFISEAPLETIKASSEDLRGAIAATSRSFLFTVEVNTFHGFNSGLQREHFNENYLETSSYPKMSFQGKFIEEVNFEVNGTYEVRAKGILEIHGIRQERILKGTVVVRGDMLIIDSQFTVLLEDHDIRIPRVVYQKILPEISVTMHAEMKVAAQQ